MVAYVVNNAIRAIVEGEFQNLLGRRRVEKRLAAIKDHFIVCGLGRMGRIVCRELKANGTLPHRGIAGGAFSVEASGR